MRRWLILMAVLYVGGTLLLIPTSGAQSLHHWLMEIHGIPLDPTLVQSQSATCAATVSCAVSLPSNTTSGNLLLFGNNFGNQSGTYIFCDGGSCSTTCPTSTDTWDTLPSNPVSDAVSGGNEIGMGYAKASTGLTSFTACVTGGGSHTLRVAVYEYSSSTGWPALASVLDTSNVNHNASAGSTGNPGNITPAASGELLMTMIEMSGSANSFTVSGTGMANQPTANGTNGTGWVSSGRADGCDNTNSGTSSTTCTFSWSGSVGYAATIGAFKPAAAATAKSFPVIY